MTPKVEVPTFDQTNFLPKFFEFLNKELYETLNGKTKVVDFKTPEELKKSIDFEINQLPMSEKYILEECQKISDHSVKVHHPRFFHTLFGGCDKFSLAGDFFSTVLNTTMYTYQMGTACTLMEASIFN